MESWGDTSSGYLLPSNQDSEFDLIWPIWQFLSYPSQKQSIEDVTVQKNEFSDISSADDLSNEEGPISCKKWYFVKRNITTCCSASYCKTKLQWKRVLLYNFKSYNACTECDTCSTILVTGHNTCTYCTFLCLYCHKSRYVYKMCKCTCTCTCHGSRYYT